MTEVPRSLDTAQYMENLKEKEELKKKLAEKEKELVEALVRSYDLQKKLDKLQAVSLLIFIQCVHKNTSR